MATFKDSEATQRLPWFNLILQEICEGLWVFSLTTARVFKTNAF